MLKANAWPYPVFENVEFQILGAQFDGRRLEHKTTAKGVIVEGQPLRTLGTGLLTVKAALTTTLEQVADYVFGDDGNVDIASGFRVFCETSKYRTLVPAPAGQPQDIVIPLQMVRGGVQIIPVFTTTQNCISSNGVALESGTVVAYARDPLTIAIDEDWTGDIIPIRWVNFETATPPLPPDALFHVELSESGQVLPELWLNEKFKNELGTVINHVGLSSPQGISGHLVRQFLWLQFWERALPWAIRHESEEQEQWPATRIADMWKTNFRRHRWDWPSREDVNLDLLEDLSCKIQHHLKYGDELAQVRRIWQT